MIPNTTALEVQDEVTPFSNITYYLDNNRKRIQGYLDGDDAVTQSAYKILSTERFAYPIYSDSYGIELMDLIGQSKSYVMAVLPTRIKDALFYDDRIEDIVNFIFNEMDTEGLLVSFDIVTTDTQIPIEMGVQI